MILLVVGASAQGVFGGGPTLNLVAPPWQEMTPVNCVAVRGDYAYVGGTGQFAVLELRSGVEPSKLSQINLSQGGETRDIVVSNDYAFVAATMSGLYIIDIRDPNNPFECKRIERMGIHGPYGVAVDPPYGGLFTAELSAGARGFYIDRPSPCSPQENWRQPGTDIPHIALCGNYVYMALCRGDSAGGILVLDRRDNHLCDDTPDEGGYPYGLAIRGGFLYAAGRDLRIYDISTNPCSPTRCGPPLDIGLPQGSYRIAVCDDCDYAAVADAEDGVVLVDISNPCAPAVVDRYHTNDSVASVAMTCGYVYAADQDGGLVILRISPRILFVDDDAPGCGDGESWGTAYKYLQDALGAAAPGNEIWVAGGTYQADRNCASPTGTGDRAATFQLKNGVVVYGGFAGNEDPTIFNLDDRDFVASETILSGDLARNDGAQFANNGENSFHVVTGSGTDARTSIDGFTITGGNADAQTGPNREGGGMWVSGCNVSILNCRFAANSAFAAGGGMYAFGGAVETIRCVFERNAAQHGGGGMFAEKELESDVDSNTVNCIFKNNFAGRGGAGMYNYRAKHSVRNCIFEHNEATDEYGGAVTNFEVQAGVSFTNCVFLDNKGRMGGGMHSSGGKQTLCGCTFNGNYATNQGGGIYSVGTLTLTNSILWGNTPDEISWDGYGNITYSDIKGGCQGEGNINADPLFVNPEYPYGDDGIIGTEDDGLRLRAGSPCIDAGNNDPVPPGTTKDLSGMPRFMDDPRTPDTGSDVPPIVDIGAYEFPANLPMYVDNDAPGDPGPGNPTISDPNENGSADHPFDSIQEAIDAAFDGDLVMVLDGSYTGDGNWGINLSGKRLWVCSENGPDDCIIDCEGLGQGFRFVSGEDRDSIVDGFTIINGLADNGGGIYCENSSPTIKRCKIVDCNANYEGGGIYVQHGSPTLENCVFIGNEAKRNGGAMENILNSYPTLINCTFFENGPGSGIDSFNSEPKLVNCILWGNEPQQIVGPNDTSYSDVQGGCPGTNNIDVDPLFVDPDGCDDVLGTADDNLRLSVDSPCIDAGYSSAVPGPNDIEGSPRIVGPGGIDMGAYEYHTMIGYSSQDWEDCNHFEFEWAPYNHASPQSLYIVNAGPGTLAWQITTQDCNWLTVNPSSGRTESCKCDCPEIDPNDCNRIPSEPNAVVELTVDGSLLEEGSYECNLTISDPYALNNPQTIPVKLSVLGCFPKMYTTYPDWVAFGKPNCWCGIYGDPPCPFQCHGDADCQKQGSAFAGYMYVSTDDLDVVIAAWQVKEPPKGLGIATIPNGICADFDHKRQGSEFAGYMRVSTNDLAVLIGSWQVKEPPKGPGLPANCPTPE